jgi:hypothetical protein
MQDPITGVDSYSHVFEGRVAGFADPSAPSPPYLVDVGVVWKGTVPTDRTVRLANPVHSCAYRFEPGRRYIVYARESQESGLLSTGLCSATRPTVTLDGLTIILALAFNRWPVESAIVMLAATAVLAHALSVARANGVVARIASTLTRSRWQARRGSGR